MGQMCDKSDHFDAFERGQPIRENNSTLTTGGICGIHLVTSVS